MLTANRIYFSGVGLLALAALQEGSPTGALVLSGIGLVIYGFAKAFADFIED